ncbi:Spy/CpxP family protein refolding chaperone [Sulfurimonas sp. CS5]|jgi:Spy/CpxP family protein refolding chaperone|uniref:Spy/CpxP family protein refolding chaperone n=1 Tax=Sulfurimonas sp. CS5 TaxID=3391145 RepID=UPI0039E8A54E
MTTKFFTIVTLLVLTIGSTSLLAKQKPFLIHGQLPHLTAVIMQLWDDEDLALTPEQKTKLKQIRLKTVGGLATLKGEVFPLEAEIVKASKNGTNPKELEEDVEKLAELRAEATMIHLKCLYNTRNILTKKQLKMLD